MVCYFPLQGIFPTQGWHPRLLCLLHWQGGSRHLSYQGSPLKPFSGINSRWSRDSNVKGEATGSLEANVECIHLLDAGKALHESSNK